MERYCELKQLGGLLDSKGYGIALPKGTNAHDPLFRSTNKCYIQGGRSCAGARGAPAAKFGLGRKFLAQTYAILSRIKICRNLRTFRAKKVPFWVKKVD